MKIDSIIFPIACIVCGLFGYAIGLYILDKGHKEVSEIRVEIEVLKHRVDSNRDSIVMIVEGFRSHLEQEDLINLGSQ